MRADKADIALMFESGFASQLERNEPAKVLIAVDASDPNTGTTMQNFVRAVIGSYEMERAKPGAINIVLDTRMRFNPTLESVNLFVPGLIALVLTLISALMTAISLSREKERGTLEVLLVSPLEPWQIIVGKVAPYLGLAFGNAVTALAVARVVFGVPVRGSLTLLLLESLLYSVVSLALGVLIAARTTSQRAAMLGSMLGTLMPSTLLSGMIFPIASMPVVLRVISNVIPARWFVVIARGIMLKGVGMNYLWKETLALTVMTIIFMAAAVRSFKPRLG
jgi:ABC-2 type transport system permease protein